MDLFNRNRIFELCWPHYNKLWYKYDTLSHRKFIREPNGTIFKFWKWWHLEIWRHFENLEMVLLGSLMNFLWYKVSHLCQQWLQWGQHRLNVRFVVKNTILTSSWRHISRCDNLTRCANCGEKGHFDVIMASYFKMTSFWEFKIVPLGSLIHLLWNRVSQLCQKWF